jgi:hypothetical protein
VPPYSPETNPIELMFNVLKAKLRAVAPAGLVALRQALDLAWSSIAAELAAAFFARCGLHPPQPTSSDESQLSITPWCILTSYDAMDPHSVAGSS